MSTLEFGRDGTLNPKSKYKKYFKKSFQGSYSISYIKLLAHTSASSKYHVFSLTVLDF